MPVKVTRDQINEIIRLRDEEKYPWSRISAETGISEKTCRKHYELRKREEEGEGPLHAQAFGIFDQGGGPADVVRQLKLSVEETKMLHEEYLEMKRRGEREIPVLEEFETFKKRASLTHLCENLLNVLDTPFEAPLADQVEFLIGGIMFLKGKIEGERNLDALEKLEELLESERKEIEALLDANKELFQERRERETEAKRKWIIQKLVDRLRVSEQEARRNLEEREAIFEEGLEGIYKVKREVLRCEEVKIECLRYMSAADYNRLSLLFLESLPDAEYIILFWRQEQDILARYGEQGWRQLVNFYQNNRDVLVRERPQLKRAFIAHLARVGLQQCSYCGLLISTVGAPPHFQCPRCGAVLRAAMPGA